MSKSNILSISKPKSYFKVLIWVFLILFSGKFIIKDALPYFGFEQETFGYYWDYKWALIGHISCGLLALVFGPFQFWKAFRNKYLTVHRWSGRIYLTAILIGTISSTPLAWTSTKQVNFSWALALQC